MDWSTIQPLFGGFLGGLLVALINIVYTNRQARKSLERERDGLLQLIDGEIYRNLYLLLKFVKGGSDLAVFITFPPKTEVWDSSRTRLAQLLDTESLTELVGYYQQVEWILINAKNTSLPEDTRISYAKSVASDPLSWGERARRTARQYREDPDFSQETAVLLEST